MDVTFGPEHEAFGKEARAWLAVHVPSGPLPPLGTPAGFEAHRDWEATMYADRWSAVSWPIAYGGRGLGIMEGLVFEEEYQRARAPARVSEDGIFLLAPILFEVGTEAQKQRYLPAIAAGEEIWCRAWPGAVPGGEGGEPGASSGRATRDPDGDGWRLSGQASWARGGADAHWCFGVFRTGPDDGGGGGGLTSFLVSLDSPGVSVRPLRPADGNPGLTDISFAGVEVPANQVLGTEGAGWSVATATAGRAGGFGLRSPAHHADAAARLIHLFDQRGAPAPAADAVARAYIDAQAYQLHTYWTASKVARGEAAGPEGGCNALFRAETDVALRGTALALLGSDAELLDAGSPGEWLDGFFTALAGPIDAATLQMHRNAVAKRLLGVGDD